MEDVLQILNQFYAKVTLWIFVVCLIGVAIWLLRTLILAIPYWRSTYYKTTQKSFLSLLLNTGAYGEYLTFKYLSKYESDGAKFLFNCYLPKDNEETSEIDVMMIYKSGIYVFESKNYSGWIFGSESGKMWTQSLPNGRKSRKEKFYNPILQNKTHIKWLEKQVEDTIPLHSIVVFSERCELKKLEISSEDISVIKRNALPKVVREIDERVGIRLDEEMISQIYDKLYPYTQVSRAVKEAHVENIEKKYKVASETVINETNPESEVKEDNNSDNVCPKCGGKLVLRTAKSSERAGNHFYGCSNYPKCRFIKNI